MAITDAKGVNATKTIRIASYNIRHGADVSQNMSLIGDDITSNDIDIVGFQEIDMETKRIGGINPMTLLAEATGYKYWKFAKALDYGGGGYGNTVLSRHPIERFETILLESCGKEQRSIGHAVINVNGCKIDFFNTHLSFESEEIRKIQFMQVAKLVGECKSFILTGDFNTSNFDEFKVIENAFLANNNDTYFGTYTSDVNGIDNIVMSKDVFTVVKSEMGPTDHSDHRMFWSELAYIG